MLEIIVPDTELYDEKTNTFIYVKKRTIRLEHSLISASLWEAKWKRCFIDDGPKTAEEVLDYIKCMTIDKQVDDNVYSAIKSSDYEKIINYIGDPMTATTINDRNQKGKANQEKLTTELIYYYMTAFNIPFSCEKWHLNRLIMLIKVCSVKNAGENKMGKNEILKQNRDLNKIRRAKTHSRG